MKEMLMRDILCDMAVCEIEGWDKLEYLDDLLATIKRLRFGPAARPAGLHPHPKNPTR